MGFETGMRWSVGNGEKIHMWKDPWISDTQTRKILSPRGEANEDVKVGVLIDPIRKGWKVDLISQLLFPFEVVECIMRSYSKGMES